MATTEAIDVVMPQMGVSVSEGTITKWLKAQGDQVEADEPLLEISTDKVDTEVPSPGTGVLTEILVQEGQTVDVGTKLAVIGGDGTSAPSGSEPQAQAPPEPAAQAAADASMAAASEGIGAVAPSQEEAAEPAEAAQAAESAATNGKTFVSPVVAKIASEHGVDPSQVRGTGRGACGSGSGSGSGCGSSARARARARAGNCNGSSSFATRRIGRADDGDAQRHRGAHAPLARHLRARHERDRGRHVEGRRDPRQAEEGIRAKLRRQSDLSHLRRTRHGRGV